MKVEESLTVFYIKLSDKTWLGGNHYFDNLTANTLVYYPKIKFVGIDSFEIPVYYSSLLDKLKFFLQKKIKKTVSPDLLKKGRIQFLEKDIFTKNACIYSVAVDHIRGTEKFPRIYWIPDFQVYHLPHFFTEKDINFRKRSYLAGTSQADLVVLSSKDALKDFELFFPEHAKKGRVLNFVVDVPQNAFTENPNQVLSRYTIPEKFFYMPNQFWQHKNHLLLLEAIRLLKVAGHKIFVVLSGTMEDRRNPNHVKSLLDFISENNLEQYVSILGVIPKEDVLLLMRQCCAMINPSRFEGWSTTVEESKSLGKRMLLSSIDVHIEQNPPKAKYFGCDDAILLSELLLQTWNETESGPDLQLEAEAKESLIFRKKKFADDFITIINEAISIHSTNIK